VQAAFAFLIEDMSTNDALDCGRYQHRDCLWGAIAALKALAAHGYAHDARFVSVLNLLLNRQDNQGRWVVRFCLSYLAH
jgi:hypothetical protein